MATLNKLAAQVCDALNRPYEHMLIERVKDMIIQERGTFLHRTFDKYGIDRYFVEKFIVELVKVNRSSDPNIPVGQTYLRSINKIPSTLRVNTNFPFVFCGSIDHKVTFGYAQSHMLPYIGHIKLIGNQIKYDFIDSDIYILNNTKLKTILVEAAWESLDITYKGDLNSDTGVIYRDNMEFPLYGDQLNAVVTSVITQLRNANDLKQESESKHRNIQ